MQRRESERMTKCEFCIHLKHRYTILTGMHYPEIQEALNKQQIKAKQFNCEGMGCEYHACGAEINSDDRDIDWSCPHFKRKTLKNGTSKERLRIDSHANINEYPKQIELGKFAHPCRV